MNILFITHYTQMYGANKSLYDLAVSLATDSKNHISAVIPEKCELSESFEKKGIKCYYSPITTWQAVYVNSFRFEVKKLIRKRKIKKEFDYLYSLLKNEKIDIIHSNSSVIGTGAFLAEKLGCKHVWHIREFSEEHYAMRYFYGKDTVRKYYESANALITISDALKDNYIKRYPKANVVRIYDGLIFGNTEKRKHTDKTHLKMCYTGYVYPMKHQLELVKLCRNLVDEGLDDFELFFFGDGKKEYVKTVQDAVNNENLSDRIHLMGYVADVDNYLKDMDIGVIASEYEAFGRVTVEYMVHGLPVIGYDCGGTSEIVEDGVTGFLYKDAKQFTQAFRRLKDYELRNRMGEAGYCKAVSKYDVNECNDAVTKLYESV